MTREQFDARIDDVMGAVRRSAQDDTVQETLVRIYEEHLYLNHDNNITTARLQAWFRGCCANTKKRMIQKDVRNKEFSAGMLTTPKLNTETCGQVDDDTNENNYMETLINEYAHKPEELIHDVQKALSQFEEPLRSDLYDFWTGAVTIAEIAKERNESYAAVQKRIHRASDKLRQSLADYQGASCERSTKTLKEVV